MKLSSGKAGGAAAAHVGHSHMGGRLGAAHKGHAHVLKLKGGAAGGGAGGAAGGASGGASGASGGASISGGSSSGAEIRYGGHTQRPLAHQHQLLNGAPQGRGTLPYIFY